MERAIAARLIFNHSKVRRVTRVILACTLMALHGCNNSGGQNNRPANSSPPAAGPTATAMDASQIIERNRALDTSRDSTMKIKARIQGPDAAPPEVEMVVSRKREPNGRLLMLVEMTAPAEERDRSAIVTVTPEGEVEGTRYAQSGNTFVSTKGVMSEDSLFGMTLQELADGQPEKYDFKLIGEETTASTPAYKLEGALKPGAESRFNRLVMLVSKESFATVGAEFYDNHNELVRRLIVDKIEQVAGHPTRMHWIVDNVTKQKRVEFTTVDAKYDQNLSSSIFTRAHLKKISER